MKVIMLPNNLYYAKERPKTDALCRSEKRWNAALCISALTGVLSGLTGLALSVLSHLGVSDQTARFGHTDTWLVAAFIPLMLFAAHAMDKAQQAKKAIRLEYGRKHGFKE